MKNYEELSRMHFDKQAPIYDETETYSYSKNPKISCHDAAKTLGAMAYDSMLDVGCGTGYLLEMLAEQSGAKHSGIDLSAEMIRVAKAKNITGASFVVGSAEALPYDDNTFDVVTCIQSFHHYPHPDKAMQEVLRVLKPGGIYLLSDTGIGGIGGWVNNHILFKLMKSGDCHTDNQNGIAKRMAKNGFTVTEKRQLKKTIYTVVGKKN